MFNSLKTLFSKPTPKQLAVAEQDNAKRNYLIYTKQAREYSQLANAQLDLIADLQKRIDENWTQNLIGTWDTK